MLVDVNKCHVKKCYVTGGPPTKMPHHLGGVQKWTKNNNDIIYIRD